MRWRTEALGGNHYLMEMSHGLAAPIGRHRSRTGGALARGSGTAAPLQVSDDVWGWRTVARRQPLPPEAAVDALHGDGHARHTFGALIAAAARRSS